MGSSLVRASGLFCGACGVYPMGGASTVGGMSPMGGASTVGGISPMGSMSAVGGLFTMGSVSMVGGQKREAFSLPVCGFPRGTSNSWAIGNSLNKSQQKYSKFHQGLPAGAVRTALNFAYQAE